MTGKVQEIISKYYTGEKSFAGNPVFKNLDVEGLNSIILLDGNVRSNPLKDMPTIAVIREFMKKYPFVTIFGKCIKRADCQEYIAVEGFEGVAPTDISVKQFVDEFTKLTVDAEVKYFDNRNNEFYAWWD